MRDEEHPVAARFWQWVVVLFILLTGVWLRLYGLTSQGFHDGDEYAKHLFYTTDWYRQVLNDGVSGSLWARPSAHFLNIFLGNQFGFYSETYNIKNAAFSTASLILVFFTAKRFFGFYAATLTIALVSGSLSMLYWSHTSKEIVPSTFFFLAALFYLLIIVERFEGLGNVKLIDAVTFGFFTGLAFTFHPNLAITAVSMGLVFGGVLIAFAIRTNVVEAAKIGVSTLISTLLLVVFYESIFQYIKFSESWLGTKEIGYLKYIFYHSDLRSSITPSLRYYLEIFKIEQTFAVMTTLIGVLFATVMINKKRYVVLSLGFVVVFVMIIYTNSDVWPAFRNVIHLLFPIYILAGAGFGACLEKLNLSVVTKAIIITISAAGAMSAGAMQAAFNLQNWSTAERIHWEAGGGASSAIYRPKQPIYHWYQYYFPHNLIDDDVGLWKAYLCGRVDYLVSPELSLEPDLVPWIEKYGYIRYNSDDAFRPWASGYLELAKVFDEFQHVHGQGLLRSNIISLNGSSNLISAERRPIVLFEQKHALDPASTWVTISGDVRSMGGLGDKDFLLVAVGSETSPFLYDAQIIEADTLSKNRRAQLIANNTGGFFKVAFGKPLNVNDVHVRVFWGGSDRSGELERLPVKVREYASSGNGPPICASKTVSADAQNRLQSLVSVGSANEAPERINLPSVTKNTVSVWDLKPGGLYRLSFNYKLGPKTVGRVEVVNNEKLVAHQLLFRPSDSRSAVTFQLPFDLDERVIIDLSAASGAAIEYGDPVLERLQNL